MADSEHLPSTLNEEKENEGEVRSEEVKSDEDSKMAVKDDSQDVNNADVDDTTIRRTVASKSEGEAEDEDEEDVDFPGGAIIKTPTKSHTLPTSSSPVVTPTSPTSPTSDKKKKRFQPFKSIRKLFSKKRKEDEDILPSNQPQQLSRSTGHLDRTIEEEGETERSKSVSPSALLGRPISMSEDSVFSPDLADHDQRPVTPANKDFANELASKLQHRQTVIPSKKPDDESIGGSVIVEDLLDESSTRDSGVSLDDEHYIQNVRKPKSKIKQLKRPWKSFSPSSSASAVAAKQKVAQKKLQAAPIDIFADFDSIAAPSSLLVSDAAKHRISIKPQRKRRPPSRLRPTSTPDEETTNENSKAPLSPTASSPPVAASAVLTPPSLNVPKETKPAQRSESDKKVQRTSSDAKDKVVDDEKPKPSKEKVLPPVATKPKDSREEDAAKQAGKHSKDVPIVEEKKTEETVKENKPLVLKSSKEKVPPPGVHDLKPKTVVITKGKTPVKVPVAPKSSADKAVNDTQSDSKSEKNMKDTKKRSKTENVKDEEKENKVPTSVPTEKKDEKAKEKKTEEKNVPSVETGSENAPSEEKNRPSTPPKPRKQINVPDDLPAVNNQNEDKSDDEEPPAKPLSLKERMALLKSAAGNEADKTPTPSWKKPSKPNTTKSEPAPKNVFIHVTDGPKSSPVENGNKEQEESKISSNSGSKRPAPNKKPFIPKTEKCIVCDRPVYLTEMAKADGQTFHKACQKCMECRRTLVIGNILMVGGKLFCKLHGTQEKNQILKKRLELD